MERKVNVCGILSIVLSGISFFFCWWLGIIGIILGIIGLFVPGNERITAIIGISLGSVSLFLFAILIMTM